MRALKITKLITNRQSESIDKYLQDISKIPLIGHEEETQLAKRIKEGDTIAFEKLIRANLRFVVSVAKQYQHSSLTLGDLINEGNVGLIKAAQKFDESRGFKFISYAVWWIRQSIMQAISEKSRVVRMPQNRVGMLIRINKTSSFLEQQFEREPTLDELSDSLNIPSDEISEALKMGNRQTSIDAPLGAESENCLLDVLVDKSSYQPDTLLNQNSLKVDLRRAVLKLPPKVATVITLYYGLNGIEPMVLEDIGHELNLTRERVRQLKDQGLKRLSFSPVRNSIKSHID